MRKFMLIVGVVLALCGSAFGQDVPRAEVFGGYSYLNVDTNGLSPRQSANGWEASVTGNFNRWFGVEGDFSGYYKIYPVNLFIVNLPLSFNVNVSDYGFLGGPRVSFGPAFAHALIGGDHLTGSALGFSASQDSLAGAFGGGVEFPMSGRWAVRASADYVFTRHNILGGPSFTQNNVRVSAGIVFRFGGVRSGSISSRGASPAAQPPVAASEEAALLGVSGYTVDNGFKITSVRAGSPAAQIFLHCCPAKAE